MSVTVLVVDDHPLVRGGLVSLLSGTDDVDVVGEASNGREAVDLAAGMTDPLDVVLMDLSMPVLDGVEATRELVSAHPGIAVIVLTSFADQPRVAQALQAGAVGYLLKDCDPRDVVAAVRSAAAGGAPLDPRVARSLLPSAGAGPAQVLSARELQVLRLVAQGLANKQVARALGISERTVKVHVTNIFRAIGVGDRTSAALWAREHLPESIF
ncbi:MAG TPA: response regulator transcription factor [Dermatophilaceae bacterium]|nr:response regulator transcription factor [Dermatophilaceae bacterium]